MQVSRCAAEHQLYDAFLISGEQAGQQVASDHNGFRQEGLHIAQSSIHRGLRWSTARGFLRPAIRRPNLHLLSRTQVTKIVVSGGVATGIGYADGRTLQNENRPSSSACSRPRAAVTSPAYWTS